MSRDSGAGAYAQSAGMGARSCFRSSSVTRRPSLAPGGREPASRLRCAQVISEGRVQCGRRSSLGMFALVAVVARAVAGPARSATGARSGAAQVVRAEPGAEPRRRVAHRPEGLRRRRPGGGVPRRPADEPRRQRLPARRLRERLQRDRQPRVLADEHVRLHAAPGRVRAGDGVLLDHRGAEVHPEPRLRRRRAARSTTEPQDVRINQSARTTRSRPTTRRTSSASARAASTTPRTPR